jgi:hypothetical protein
MTIKNGFEEDSLQGDSSLKSPRFRAILRIVLLAFA